MLSFKQFLTEATEGEDKWVKYFKSKDGVQTTIKGSPKYFDAQGKLLGTLEPGTAVTYVDNRKSWLKGLYLNSHEVKLDDGKQVYVAFNNINKPGSKATEKELSGLKPSDFLEKFTNLTPQTILAQVQKKFGKDSVLSTATQETIKFGYPKTPIVLDGLSEAALTNYFCEVLHPIAIINGTVTGNADAGINAIAGTESAKGFLINFSTGVTTGLYDSYLTQGNSRINLSSKFGSATQSAKASVTNLFALYQNIKNPEIINEYKIELGILETIQTETADSAPLKLAVNFKIITAEDMSIILKLKDNPETKLTKTLISMRDSMVPGKDSTPVQYYWVIAAVAKAVCNYINTKTKFSTFASLLLNGSIIQVYTKVVSRNNTLTFKPFDTKWPDDAVTNVMIESGTRYKTNRIDGKMGFVVKSKV